MPVASIRAATLLEVMEPDSLAAIPPEGEIHREAAAKEQDRVLKVREQAREQAREQVLVRVQVLAAAIRMVRDKDPLPVDPPEGTSQPT